MDNTSTDNSEYDNQSLRDRPFSEIAKIVSSEIKEEDVGGSTDHEPVTEEGQSTVYAGLGVRIAAFLIDTVILVVPALIIAAIVVYTNPGYYSNLRITGFIINTLYFSITESSVMQASFGKRVMNLKVIDKHGNRITLPRAILRYLAKIISIVPIFAGILTIRTDEKHQGWHDMIVGTYVVENK